MEAILEESGAKGPLFASGDRPRIDLGIVKETSHSRFTRESAAAELLSGDSMVKSRLENSPATPANRGLLPEDLPLAAYESMSPEQQQVPQVPE